MRIKTVIETSENEVITASVVEGPYVKLEFQDTGGDAPFVWLLGKEEAEAMATVLANSAKQCSQD